jgi:plasmid rolling circle replication initiator protein Rep
MKQNYLKTLSLAAADNLIEFESEIPHAIRQSRCAEFFHYVISPDLSMRLNRSNFCDLRSCPLCCWVKSAKWRIRIFQGLPRLLADYPSANFSFLFLTLTVRNCHFGQLRSNIRSMEQGWNRLSQRRKFPGLGYLKSLEVSRPRDCFYAGEYVGRMGSKLIQKWKRHLRQWSGYQPELWREFFCEEVHPHLHILLMVDESYFQPANYLDNSEWRSMWQRSAQLDYQPIVDVRKIRDIEGGIFEVSKYCLKSSDMVDTIGCLTVRQLHDLRLLSIGGAFSSYFSQAAMDTIAESGDMGDEQRQLGVPCHYEWDGTRYRLTRLGEITRSLH